MLDLQESSSGVTVKSFILLSFGFLGLVFYELSGGADFDPGAIREARLAALSAEERARAERRADREAEVIVAKAPAVVVDTDPPVKPFDGEVSRVSLNLTTLSPTPASARRNDQQQAVAAVARSGSDADTSSVPRNVSVVTASADTPAIIPSLINPSEGVSVSTAEQVVYEDVRTVSGNRVNVRGGPGTSFGVVGSMVRGDAVVVLEDNGSGWVRFESMDGDTQGWMADFLLNES